MILVVLAENSVENLKIQMFVLDPTDIFGKALLRLDNFVMNKDCDGEDAFELLL